MAEPETTADGAPDAADERPFSAATLRTALIEVVRRRGYEYREQPFVLSSGGTSRDYVDMRRAVALGRDLLLAAEAVLAHLAELGWEFDAIGGMTMGADPVAHVAAVLGSRAWFSVRKAEKDHGTGRQIEGAPIDGDTRVVVFEDTVSTGRSLLDALGVVQQSGAEVIGALTILDRGESTRELFFERGVAYSSLMTYKDLGIAPLEGPATTPSE